MLRLENAMWRHWAQEKRPAALEVSQNWGPTGPHASMGIPLLRGPCLGVPRTRIIVYRVDDGAPSVCERTFLLLSGMHPEHLRCFVGLHSTCACTACQDCFTEDLIGCVRLQQVTQCSRIG